MDKLKLAHDWAMKSFLTDGFKDEVERAVHAWQYADAMQAEAEKRVNKERPEALCGVGGFTGSHIVERPHGF